ncbi:hypothetical protein [Sphaerisporangium sp. TRM90804]|uniref:hypothetical protein n=1 Tax=Sphaerisporangium sp. TRM90804 TaxID=3031113 RepID=UPI002446DF1E|nr:hypothetical protein [Sphaerisporangium sp. TRM90804]MDH2430879.1 hypothetical protein [Sphaerisporangium sp. TRM90804]
MDEKELRALLIKATEDRPAGIDLLPAATPRRRRTRVLVPALTAAGLAAAASAVVLVLPGSQPSAQAQVAAAAASTGSESYRIHGTSGHKAFDGAFDPARRVGYVTQPANGAETRFVGDLMYVRTGHGAKWMAGPRIEGELNSAPQVIALVKLAPLDPQAALERLRSATDVREGGPASGEGWSGQRFTFALEGQDAGPGKLQGASPDATGTVDVDEQGRVRRLEVAFSDTGQRNVTDFTDFGTAVTVQPPPADQIEQLPSDKNPTDKHANPSDAPHRPEGKPVDGPAKPADKPSEEQPNTKTR